MVKFTATEDKIVRGPKRGTDVAHGVAHDECKKIILDLVRNNHKIARAQIAQHLGISEKTVEREIKHIECLKYVGSGDKGYLGNSFDVELSNEKSLVSEINLLKRSRLVETSDEKV